MIVTVERYRAITGDLDTAPGDVSARVEDATALLEEDLRRPLASEERVEVMWPDRHGWLWPAATPITVADGYTVEGDGIMADGFPFTVSLIAPLAATQTVTYTGGFVERSANPAAINRLPVHIERDIAWAAYALGHPDIVASQIPEGATAVSVGDIAVSFGPGGARGTVVDLAIRWSRSTMRHKRRFV